MVDQTQTQSIFFSIKPCTGTFELLKLNILSVSQKVKASCPFQNVDLYGEERARNSMDTLLNQDITKSWVHYSCCFYM